MNVLPIVFPNTAAPPQGVPESPHAALFTGLLLAAAGGSNGPAAQVSDAGSTEPAANDPSGLQALLISLGIPPMDPTAAPAGEPSAAAGGTTASATAPAAARGTPGAIELLAAAKAAEAAPDGIPPTLPLAGAPATATVPASASGPPKLMPFAMDEELAAAEAPAGRPNGPVRVDLPVRNGPQSLLSGVAIAVASGTEASTQVGFTFEPTQGGAAQRGTAQAASAAAPPPPMPAELPLPPAQAAQQALLPPLGEADALAVAQPQASSLPSTVAGTALRHGVPHAAEQIAIHVGKALQENVDRIRIQLDPAELGRVDVKLEVGHDGRVLAVIAAERQETLDLLQRDSRTLERALQEAGLKPDSQSLNFSLRGDGQDGRPGSRGSGPSSTPDPGDPVAASELARRPIAGDGALDILV